MTWLRPARKCQCCSGGHEIGLCKPRCRGRKTREGGDARKNAMTSEWRPNKCRQILAGSLWRLRRVTEGFAGEQRKHRGNAPEKQGMYKGYIRDVQGIPKGTRRSQYRRNPGAMPEQRARTTPALRMDQGLHKGFPPERLGVPSRPARCSGVLSNLQGFDEFHVEMRRGCGPRRGDRTISMRFPL